jgi:hypothetical protein
VRHWLLPVLLVFPALAAAEESELAVRYEAGRLSVSARAAPLEDVLAKVATASGVRIEMESAPGVASGETVTLTVEDVSLEDGLRRLLGNQAFVLVYSPAGLAEVRVYAGPSGGAARDDADVEAGESAPREPAPGLAGAEPDTAVPETARELQGLER